MIPFDSIIGNVTEQFHILNTLTRNSLKKSRFRNEQYPNIVFIT